MASDRLARAAKKAAHEVAYDIETEAVMSRQLGDPHLAQFLSELAVVIHRKADSGGYYGGGRLSEGG